MAGFCSAYENNGKTIFLPLSVNWTSEFLPIYNKVIPWGWNPSLVRRLQEAGFPDTAYPSVERMKRIRQISGRQTAVKVLRRLCRHIGGNIPTLGRLLYCHQQRK